MGLGTDDRVIAVITENAASLLAVARAHSLCADDAHDAYQRTLVIYLERMDQVEAGTAGSWLRTVCKHEAMRIREQRSRVLPAEEVIWDLHVSVEARDPVERVTALDRVARAAEALQDLKRDQVTAMLLRADGSSYAEITALTGWSYTKVNRSLAEGRRRFLARFAAIDDGSACEAWAPVLSAIADGEATAADLTRVRPHLRRCASCRATLKALYDAEPALGALVPAGAVVASGGIGTRVWEAVVTGLGDRLARLHLLVEALTSTKAVAVVASTVAVAGISRAPAVPVPHAPARATERAAVPARAEPVRRRVEPTAVARAEPARARPRTRSADAPHHHATVVRRTAAVAEFGFEAPPAANRYGATMHRKLVASRGGPPRSRGRKVAGEFAFEG